MYHPKMTQDECVRLVMFFKCTICGTTGVSNHHSFANRKWNRRRESQTTRQWELHVRKGTCWHTGRTVRVLREGVTTTDQMRLCSTACVALPSSQARTSSTATPIGRVFAV